MPGMRLYSSGRAPGGGTRAGRASCPDPCVPPASCPATAGGHPAPDSEGETPSGLPPRRRRYLYELYPLNTAVPGARDAAAKSWQFRLVCSGLAARPIPSLGAGLLEQGIHPPDATQIQPHPMPARNPSVSGGVHRRERREGGESAGLQRCPSSLSAASAVPLSGAGAGPPRALPPTGEPSHFSHSLASCVNGMPECGRLLSQVRFFGP